MTDEYLIYNTVEKRLVQKGWQFSIISMKYSKNSYIKKMKNLYIWETIIKYMDNYMYEKSVDITKILKIE